MEAQQLWQRAGARQRRVGTNNNPTEMNVPLRYCSKNA